MSKFSTYLKRLIADSGESISSLARTIGAERTSIHKALADERILSYKTVQALARHFNRVLYPAAYLAVCLVNGNRSRCTRQRGSGCTTHHGEIGRASCRERV